VDLLADLGNTRAHLALREGDRLLATWDVPHGEGSEDGWDAGLAGHPPPRRAALLHVRPAMRDRWLAWARARGLTPRVLREDLPLPLRLEVARPEQVGADRLAGALWAARAFPGQAVLLFDLGTALTCSAVSAQGAFRGGAIAPGLSTGAWALAERTARLPRVTPVGGPPPLAGDTEGCIQSGLFWSAVGLIEALVARSAAALGGAPRVVATGGDAALIAPHCPAIERVEPRATLLGLALALDEADLAGAPRA
jgi:type III pantothenate kinase